MTIASIRIDKWLWAVRFYKTRTLAAQACAGGKIEIAEVNIKPSRLVKIGDVVNIRKEGITLTIKVTDIIEKRVSAPLAKACYEDLTPEEEKNKKKEIFDMPLIVRDKGSGRPTKKERREIDRMIL